MFAVLFVLSSQNLFEPVGVPRSILRVSQGRIVENGKLLSTAGGSFKGYSE